MYEGCVVGRSIALATGFAALVMGFTRAPG